MPGFAGQTIKNQQYVQNSAITILELPKATGGNIPLAYSLSPVPAGFIFNLSTRTLTGTPITPVHTDMTYTARNVDGDTTITTFFVVGE